MQVHVWDTRANKTCQLKGTKNASCKMYLFILKQWFRKSFLFAFFENFFKNQLSKIALTYRKYYYKPTFISDHFISRFVIHDEYFSRLDHHYIMYAVYRVIFAHFFVFYDGKIFCPVLKIHPNTFLILFKKTKKIRPVFNVPTDNWYERGLYMYFLVNRAGLCRKKICDDKVHGKL